MDLITPGIGLVFWMTLSFIFILIILKKFAWKPILGMLKEREDSIETALREADNMKTQMERMKSDHENLLQQAREERDSLLKDARDARDKIVNDAKSKATEESNKIIKSAKETIENEKMAAVTELKNQVATLSIEIAEKILNKQLSSEDKQKALVDNLIDEVSLN